MEHVYVQLTRVQILMWSDADYQLNITQNEV